MAEASAKMHLRESVRADDVDLAVSLVIGAFLGAQKLSVKRGLERSFQKYTRLALNHEELLAFLLRQMIRERVQRYQAYHYEHPSIVTVKVIELNARVSDRICS